MLRTTPSLAFRSIKTKMAVLARESFSESSFATYARGHLEQYEECDSSSERGIFNETENTAEKGREGKSLGGNLLHMTIS